MDKVCFIISTIGSENSPERASADEKLEFLIKPVLKDKSYTAIRADEEDIPGSISRKIVERIINSEMVIADISDENPNVFYELAIRNAISKPVIILKAPEQKPPFDIQDTRAISVDMTKPGVWKAAQEQLKNQIIAAEKDPEQASKSIISDFTFQVTTEVKDDTEAKTLRSVKDLQEQMRRVSSKIGKIEQPLFEEFSQQPHFKSVKQRKPNRLVVRCNKCSNIIIPKIEISPLTHLTTEDYSLEEECPNCGHKDEYFRKNFFYFVI